MTQQFCVTVTEFDTHTGERRVLVNNAKGLAEAAQQLGVSQEQMSKYCMGKANYGPRYGKRFKYTFSKVRIKEEPH